MVRYNLILIQLIVIGQNQTILLAQESLIQNSINRESLSLNGRWHYIIDPYEAGSFNFAHEPFDMMEKPHKDGFFVEYHVEDQRDKIEHDFDRMPTIVVPGDWNSQDDRLFYYEGTIWYKRSFDYVMQEDDNRLFLVFDGANYNTTVYLNGRKIGSHSGGFTPFNFEITQHTRQHNNFLVVKVNNRRSDDQVPGMTTDWFNYGGLTRDVRIIEVPPVFIRDYTIRLKRDSYHTIEGEIKLDGPGRDGRTIQLSIPDLGIDQLFQADKHGIVSFELETGKLKTWTPGNQNMYNITLSCESDTIVDRVGFRQLETEDNEILLNGEPVFLRGICIHEENPMRRGRAYSREDARILLGWAKELGCNFVRLAHYPHNEYMVRMAEEIGLMVWSEIPVYWTIQWFSEKAFNAASDQLKEMIQRDKNRAGVIIWSIANETPVTPERLYFLRRLSDTVRAYDPTRLVSAALLIHQNEGIASKTLDDPLSDFVDVISFNHYHGWYGGKIEELASLQFDFQDVHKPVLISEFGAGALQGYHSEGEVVIWTEEYQDFLYRETLKMIDNIPQLRGFSPWILADFRSPRRLLPGIQDGWNRKGLISETGNRKKAFYTLQRYYKEMID